VQSVQTSTSCTFCIVVESLLATVDTYNIGYYVANLICFQHSSVDYSLLQSDRFTTVHFVALAHEVNIRAR